MSLQRLDVRDDDGDRGPGLLGLRRKSHVRLRYDVRSDMPMNGSVDLNAVATFVRVVERGGFTSAAASLGVPKSSVSRSVKRLEQELGVRLLQRTTRRLNLTEAGRAYYESVANALAGMDEARAAITDMQDTPRGTVRVTAPPDIGAILLAPIVARFVRKYPEVRVELSLTSRFVDLVHEGIDLA